MRVNIFRQIIQALDVARSVTEKEDDRRIYSEWKHLKNEPHICKKATHAQTEDAYINLDMFVQLRSLHGD